MTARWLLAASIASCGIAGVIAFGWYMHSIRSTVIVACETGGASIENLRWVEARREVYVAQSLLPGERGRAALGSSPSPRRGHLVFDLVVGGGRVVLRTRDAIRIAPGETKHVALSPRTAVDHALLD
jgi:hypothetical protein